jgi:hypothetical protein
MDIITGREIHDHFPTNSFRFAFAPPASPDQISSPAHTDVAHGQRDLRMVSSVMSVGPDDFGHDPDRGVGPHLAERGGRQRSRDRSAVKKVDDVQTSPTFFDLASDGRSR